MLYRYSSKTAYEFRSPGIVIYLYFWNYFRRPIIGCIGMQGHEKSWEQSYHLFPYGPCSLVVKAGGRLDIESIYSSTKNISAGWGYPNEGYVS
jgi:hypothetical protein